MDHLKLFLLGPPQIELGDRSLTFPRRKTLALLIYLAVTGTPQRRDTLATLLWPDSPQRQARASLSRDLSLLNSALGQDWLAADRETVSLNHGPELWLDVAQFQQQITEPQNHGHPATEICAACLACLATATSLYRDNFLSGFTLQDSPNFDDWQLFQAERLRRELVEALSHLAQGYAGQAEFKTALTYAQRWVSLDALHEPAQRCLMQLYAQAGDRTAALRQYQTCSDLLEAELGLAPLPETVQLYEAIKSTQRGKGPEAQGGGGTRSQNLKFSSDLFGEIQHPHNLPAQITPLLGREVELRQLAQLLAEPELRLISLVGPGGIGKTHLALEVARQQLQQFPDGVYFVSLAAVESPVTIIATTAKALNFSFYEGTTPQQQLCDYLRQKRLLLVLDNFEHLLEPPSSSLQEVTENSFPGGVGLVVAWLQAAPALKILVTSRARLKLQGEQLFPLEGIDYPSDEDPSQEISRYSAVQLFVQAARRLRPDFELTRDEAPAVAQICRLMQGMPLGILLAAAWVDLFKPAEIAHRISHSFNFLAGDWRNLPTRQQSLRAVFDHSWRLLTLREQMVFQQLSIFRGGFSSEAAQAVIGDCLPELRALVNKSLLQRTPTGRYESHELLRQYAAEKLEQTAEVSKTSAVSEVRDRHSAYYCAFLQEREVDLKGTRQQAALLEIGSEGENARAAWQWAVEQAQLEQIEQALESLSLFYLWQSRLHEGETMCRLAAEKLAAALPGQKAGGQSALSAHGRVLVKILIWRSSFNRHLRQLDRAQQALQQAQVLLDSPLFVEQDTRSEQAHLLLERAEIVSNSRFGEAKDLVEQSLALYRILEDRWRLAQGLEMLGQVARNLGQLDQARRVQEDSLALRQALGDSRSIARSLRKVAGVARLQGQFKEAEVLLRKCVSMFREIGDRNQLARGVNDLGVTLIYSGKFAYSLMLFKESLEIYSDLGLPGEPGVPTVVSGFALTHLGQYEEAQLYLQKGLNLYSKIGNKEGVGYALKDLSRVALAEERYSEAQHLLQESLTIFRNLEDMNGVGQALGILGYVALRLNNRRQAHPYIHENLQIAVETRIFLPLMTALTGVALLLTDQDDKERAVELYTLVLQNPYVANSRWFEAVAGRHIVAAAAALPVEVVAAAQERGKARDLWATAEELLGELEAGGELGSPG